MQFVLDFQHYRLGKVRGLKTAICACVELFWLCVYRLKHYNTLNERQVQVKGQEIIPTCLTMIPYLIGLGTTIQIRQISTADMMFMQNRN